VPVFWISHEKQTSKGHQPTADNPVIAVADFPMATRCRAGGNILQTSESRQNKHFLLREEYWHGNCID